MNAYELMINTNLRMIEKELLTDIDKQNITCSLLAARSTPETAKRFYIGVRYPDNTGKDGGRMYPEFFIPPYNDGKKHKTVTGQTPKTHILSANSYELEILRLLILFAPDNREVLEMKTRTLERLRSTCYGAKGCVIGECFDTSLVVLRFLAVAAPWDLRWMKSIIDVYNRHSDEKKRPKSLKQYYLLCLTELPVYIAEPEMKKLRCI